MACMRKFYGDRRNGERNILRIHIKHKIGFYGQRVTVTVKYCAYTLFCYGRQFYVDRGRNRKILVAHTLYCEMS